MLRARVESTLWETTICHAGGGKNKICLSRGNHFSYAASTCARIGGHRYWVRYRRYSGFPRYSISIFLSQTLQHKISKWPLLISTYFDLDITAQSDIDDRNCRYLFRYLKKKYPLTYDITSKPGNPMLQSICQAQKRKSWSWHLSSRKYRYRNIGPKLRPISRHGHDICLLLRWKYCRYNQPITGPVRECPPVTARVMLRAKNMSSRVFARAIYNKTRQKPFQNGVPLELSYNTGGWTKNM